MNKIKFGFLSLVVALGLVSCNGNDYEYTPAQEAGQYNFGFVGEKNLVLAMTDTEVQVTLNRVDDTEEQTIPLKVISAPDFVTVPETVTFAQGQKQAVVTLTLGEEMTPCTTYQIQLAIDEKYTQPYDAEKAQPAVYDFTIYKEDYELVANGTFESSVAWKGSWGVSVEYSEYLNLYRIPDLIADGTNYYFHFNQDGETQEFWFTDASGSHKTAFESGYVHPSYGMMITTINESYPMGYDEDPTDGNYFYWVWKVSVSAGSFGENYQYLTVEWLKKPWEENTEEE